MGGCCDVKSSGGIATVLATCLLSIGWALNVAALSTCRLVATDGFRDTENDNGLVTGLGLYTFEGSNEWGQSYCYIFEYTTLTSNFSYWVDTRMNAARITSGIASFVAFCCMVFSWCGFCCGCLSVRPIRIALGVLSLIQAILLSCIFLVNSSEVCRVSTSCSFSTGGGLAIGALVAYVGASVLFCAARSEENTDDKGDDQLPYAAATAAGPAPGTVTVEKVEHANGTVVTKTTTVNADGSQTVEETTETPISCIGNEEVPTQMAYDAKV